MSMHQVDGSFHGGFAGRALLGGQLFGVIVRLDQQQALNQLTLQIVDGKAMSEKAVGPPCLPGEVRTKPNQSYDARVFKFILRANVIRRSTDRPSIVSS